MSTANLDSRHRYPSQHPDVPYASAPPQSSERAQQQQQHQQQQQQPPLNPSAYAYSNPPPRLPRINSNSSEPRPYSLPHHPSYQQSYYHAPHAQQPQHQVAAGVTPHGQGYGSPQYRSEEPVDEQADSGPSPTDGNDASDPKRSRACEACRGLKVRCDQDPENPDAPCKRCAKAKRQCIITAPSRKRQKKTDSRVAELEKKIDALTASLNAQGPNSMSSPEGQHQRHVPANISSPDSTHSYASQSSRGIGDHYRRDGSSGPAHRQKESVERPAVQQKRRLSDGPYDKLPPQARRATIRSSRDEQVPDTLQRVATSLSRKIENVIDDRTANQIFDRYVVEMAQHMPAVVFTPQTTAHQIRTTKPILFLSIVVAASVGVMPLEPQEELTDLLMDTLAHSIIRLGGKSLELVQALIIAVTWYRPPKRYEQMNFYQLTHIAATMAIDVGMGKCAPGSRTGRPQTGSEQARMPKYLMNPGTLEARRTWLGCYFLCSNTAMTLRRPNLVRWSCYMDECLEVLEGSDAALRTDKLLCQFVRLQHISEEIGHQFSMDDPSATITISDQRVQVALRQFESQLEHWNKAASSSPAWNSQLQFNEHVTALYMHEVALHINHNIDDFRAPFTEESLRAASGQSIILSQSHSKALSECLTAVHGTMQSFFNMDIATIRALPIFYFVRVAYAVVVLIKLFFAVTAPGSEVGKVISKEDLQVEHHLDTLLRIFHTIDDEESFRPANKFLLILGKLREWFTNNKDSKTVPRDASKFNPWAATQHAEEIIRDPQRRDTPVSHRSDAVQPTSRQQQAQQHRFNSNSTPLHVLSAVATNAGGQSLSSHSSPGAQITRASAGQQLQNTSVPTDQGSYQRALGGGASMQAPGFDPNAIGDAGEFNMGVGFEQAMDMAMGTSDADLSSMFMGDPMFNFGAMASGEGMAYYQGW